MNRSVVRTLVAATFATALGSAASDASAQTFGFNDRRPFESPQNFAIGVRFGPYWPAVDAEFTNVHPFQDIFGSSPNFNTPSLRVIADLEFEWQAVRLWRIASLGIGASAGFSTFVEQAPFTLMMAGPPSMWTRSTENTSLSIVPTTLHAVLRLDGLARHIPYFPIAPYIKAGLAYDFWWVTNGQGVVQATPNQLAFGGSLGWHAAVGASLLLDVFEPRIARAWDQTEGINHSWLFFEYYLTDLAGFGNRPQLNVGNFSTGSNPGANLPVGSWVLGLMLEF